MIKVCEFFGFESFGMIDIVLIIFSVLVFLDDIEVIKDL